MVYLFAAHTYRAYTDFGGWKMDFTGTQMLLTIKLASLGATMSDKERLRADPTESERMSKYSLEQAQTTDFPSVLEYISFVYTYLGFVAGPTLELSAYQAFMRRETLPAGRFARSARVFVEALVCVAVMMGLESAGYSVDLFRSAFFLYESNLVAKFTMTWLCAVSLRFKYYFAWKLAEGACLLAGVDNAANCVVLEVELAQNVKAITDAWNLSTDRWLKHYIYERVQYTPYKGWATSATFFTSAIWHGVYPGYYLSFITAAVLTQTERMGRRVVRPYFVDTAAKPLYDLGTFVCHQLVFNSIMMPFPLLLVEDAMNFWAALYYIPLIALAAGFIVFTLMGGGRRSTPKAKAA
jgi:lysophospholipid acyltransferase